MQATVAQSWEVSEAANIRWFVHLLPSLTDFAFLLPPFILFFILQGTQHLFADGDTGWQIRTGDWILDHRAVPRTDLFSFTKPHQAWFAWEWGADVGLSLLHKSAGLPGVAFATVLLLGLISALLFRLIRRVSGDDFLAFGFTLLAICGSILHWLARPHLFTWLFVLVFSHVILSAERGNKRALLWLPPATVLWTNLHGGFFIGIALLLASVAGAIAEAVRQNRDIARDAYRLARPYALCTLACCAATFCNPYGWHLHQHVVSYLLDSKLLDNIQEYQSLNFRMPGATFFECMLLAGTASVFWCVRYRYYAAAITVLLWIHLSLVSVRNLPIFLLLAAPWMTAMCHGGLIRARSLPWLRNRKRGLLGDIARDFQPLERIERWHVASCLAVILLAFGLSSGRPGFEGRFSPKNFPVAALPPLRAAHVSRLFTSDQWADYLLYRFFPSERVFMDDRSDFYGYDLMSKYEHIMDGQHDWERNLKQFSIDAVLVAPDTAIASLLKESAHWKILADGGAFILFQKKDVTRAGESVTPALGETIARSERETARGMSLASQQATLVPGPKLHERRSL